jgi:hypothetical protein
VRGIRHGRLTLTTTTNLTRWWSRGKRSGVVYG